MKKHRPLSAPLAPLPTSAPNAAPQYETIFYRTAAGREPVKEWLDVIDADLSPPVKKRADKIAEYLRLLKERGLQLREPMIKKLVGDIYELRPFADRILFAAWTGRKFIILHHFEKRSQKTPPREIATAQQRYADYCARNAQGKKQ
jgi:phage-related protein